MDIKQIDKNFDTSFTPPEDMEWFSVLEQPFSVHGIFYSEEEGEKMKNKTTEKEMRMLETQRTIWKNSRTSLFWKKT